MIINRMAIYREDLTPPMKIKKHIMLKGLSIGALTGLLTTLIESIFLLSFDIGRQKLQHSLLCVLGTH